MQIPGPSKLPLLGNLHQLLSDSPVQKLMELSKQYGEIFMMDLPENKLVIITSQNLVNEICDEKRFAKKVHMSLKQLRPLAGNALFTASTQDPEWQKAHRILVPAFGPASLRVLFPAMLDIAEQMTLKWERFGDGYEIDIAEEMTKLTLDTIAITSFDLRFNSFYSEKMHPFVDAMIENLLLAGRLAKMPDPIRKLITTIDKRFQKNNEFMFKLSDEIVQKRVKNPEGKKHDLLNLMLNTIDTVTGERLSDENIRFQLITFLIAGHETTSGLLSFVIYELLRNPKVVNRLHEELDQVLGGRTPTYEDLTNLKYLDQILKETLRLWPTAPAFAMESLEDKTTLGGKYKITKDHTLMVILPGLHRDPKVWSEPEKFNPDRMEIQKLNQLPKDSWKPFGTGQRSCIGRGFAIQESLLILAMIFQKFDLSYADPNYELKIKETLTLKPIALRVKIKARPAKKQIPRYSSKEISDIVSATMKYNTHHELDILYGSNTGTSKQFAEEIFKSAEQKGTKATIRTLDEAINNISPSKLTIIFVSSYEGKPPKNAKKFMAWLESGQLQLAENLPFAIFGCGNTDWNDTYQTVPQKIETLLKEAGAKGIHNRGQGNAKENIFAQFAEWQKQLWETIDGIGIETSSTVSEL